MKRLAILLLLCGAAPLSAGQKTLGVAVDPRLELLTTVQLLSAEVSLTPYQSPYLYELLRYFLPFRQHRAVQLLHSLMSQHPWPDVYHYVVLCLSDPPELEWRLDPGGSAEAALLGREVLNAWVEALRDFAEESHFERFFARQTPFYYRLVAQANDELEGEELLGALEEYCGRGLREYHLALSPLLHRGGFGPRLPLGGGEYAGYSIAGPDGMANNMPTYSFRHLRELVWHEFGHSLVNPLTAARRDQLRASAHRYAPLAEQLQRTGYPTWESCVDEHLIRAITARLVQRADGEEAGRRAVEQEVSRGFVYVPALCRRLEQYERQRGAYPNLPAFLPQLLAVFAAEP